MGTRGTLGIRTNQKDYLLYNHFDSYPDGLGQEVVDFVKSVDDFQQLAGQVKNLKVVKETDDCPEEIYKRYEHLKFADRGVSTGKDWYSALRNLQGCAFFGEVDNGKVEHIMLSNNFIRDSLFCEYGYIINLDTGKLEFYKGFQKKPQSGNRYKKLKGEEYYPCAKVGECDLNNIPDDWEGKFFPNEEE